MAKVKSKGSTNHGWKVAIAGFVSLSVAFAVQLSFGVFFKPLQDAFGWSRATTSWAMTIHLLVYASAMIPAGWAIDRVNTRLLYSIAAILVGAPLILSSYISEPWQLYLIYGVPLGVGVSIYGPTILTIITRWFTKKRGRALGMVSAGVGFGTLLGAPVSNSLIVAYGWRNAFVIMGVASFLILLVCANYLKNKPPPAMELETSPAGKQASKPAASARGMTFKQAVRTRGLYLILMAQLATAFSVRVVMVHIAPHALDVGISPSMAALAIGATGGFSIIGRLVMGFVQDRIGPQRSLTITLAIQGFAMLALPFIRSDWMFFIYAVFFGFTWGGDVPQVPAITAQYFGLVSMATIYSLVMTVGHATGAIGPFVAGYVFDVTGTYMYVFLGSAAALFVGAFSVSRVRFRDKTPDRIE